MPEPQGDPRQEAMQRAVEAAIAARSSAVGGQSPIKHVVIVTQENHTYDNYFGRYPKGDGVKDLPHADDPPQFTMPFTPTHGHWSWQNRDWMAAREQYCGKDLPLYYEYAQGGVLMDRFFTDIAGPSIPNHMMMFAATAGDLINNPRPGIIRFLTHDKTVQPPFDLPSLPENLEKNGLTWLNFGDTSPYNFTAIKDSPNNVASEMFAPLAESGRLPAVSWLVAPSMDYNDHPPSNMFAGQQWLGTQVDAIVKGGLWDDTIVVLWWDDWGGYYDHVESPLVEKWSVNEKYHYRYGPRVPCLVLGGYAKADQIDSTLSSQCSVVRWVEDLFGLPYLNERDSTANSIASCVDVNQVPNPAPRPHETILEEAREAAVEHIAEVRHENEIGRRRTTGPDRGRRISPLIRGASGTAGRTEELWTPEGGGAQANVAGTRTLWVPTSAQGNQAPGTPMTPPASAPKPGNAVRDKGSDSGLGL